MVCCVLYVVSAVVFIVCVMFDVCILCIGLYVLPSVLHCTACSLFVFSCTVGIARVRFYCIVRNLLCGTYCMGWCGICCMVRPLFWYISYCICHTVGIKCSVLFLCILFRIVFYRYCM